MKKLFWTLSLAVAALLADAQQKLLHLDFEKPDADRDATGKVVLEYPNSAPEIHKGIKGNCAYFDGGGKHIRIKPSQLFDFPPEKSFTIEFFYKPERPEKEYWPAILARGTWQVRLFPKLNFPSFAVYKNNKFIYAFQGPFADKNDKWHHVAVVRDAARKTLSLFFDGKLIHETPEKDDTVFVSPKSFLFVGTSGFNLTTTFQGFLDELIIWEGVRKNFELHLLSAQAVKQPAVRIDPELSKNWAVLKEKGLNLSPCPKRLTLTGKAFPFDPSEWKVTRKKENDLPGVEAFKARLKDLKLPPLSGKTGRHEIVSGLYDELKDILKANGAPAKPIRQGYVICFIGSENARKIILAGSDEDGIRYAWLTLGNLLKENGTIQPVEISDWPDYKVRGAYYLFENEALDKLVLDEAFRARINHVAYVCKCGDDYNRKADEGVRRISQYAAARGIRTNDVFHPSLKHLKNYKQYVTPGYSDMFYIYDREKGLTGFLAGVYSWSQDGMAQDRANEITGFLKRSGKRAVMFHSQDYGGVDNPGNWNNRSERDRKRWGDDHGAADANLFNIFARTIHKSDPDIEVFFIPYPYTCSAIIMPQFRKYIRTLVQEVPNVTYLIREAPFNIYRKALEVFKPHIPIISYYPYDFTVLPSFLSTASYLATFYAGPDSKAELQDWTPVSIYHSPMKWSHAEYMWNAFAPGAEYLPDSHYNYSINFRPSPRIEEELLPRICSLLFGEKAGPAAAEAYAHKFSVRLFEQPYFIIPGNLDVKAIIEKAAKDSEETIKRLAAVEKYVYPSGRYGYRMLTVYVKQTNLLARARLCAIQARAALDNEDENELGKLRMECKTLLSDKILDQSHAALAKKQILADLDASSSISLRRERNKYAAQFRKVPLRVAFYRYSGGNGGSKVIGLLPENFNKVAGIHVSTVSDLRRSNLKEIDVLIFNADSHAGDCEEDWIANVRDFVEKDGKGVIFAHNAVGRVASSNFGKPIFPEISRGYDGQYVRMADLIVNDDSIFRNFLRKGDIYRHVYRDHLAVKPGVDAKIILVNAAGKTVTAAGSVGKGRVVYTGEIFGFSCDDKICDPELEQWKMLFQLIRFAGNADSR